MNRSLLAIQDRLNILCSGPTGGFQDTSFAGFSGVTDELSKLFQIRIQNHLRRTHSPYSDGRAEEQLILCGFTLTEISRDLSATEYTIFYKNTVSSVPIMIKINYFTEPFTAVGYLYTLLGDKGEPVQTQIHELEDLKELMNAMYSRSSYTDTRSI
jgi:hypothetical protein